MATPTNSLPVGKATPLPVGSAAAPTPASQLIRLQQTITSLELQLAEYKAKESLAGEKKSRFTTLGGVSFGGIAIAQSWAELILWESLLNEKKFRAVFELGSWEGGFAWWMSAQCEMRDMKFETYDSIPPGRLPPNFRRVDVFVESAALGALFREWEPCIVFCDNGNKPRELQTFGPALEDPNSLVVVHDWGTEIQPGDVPDELVMVYEEFCVEIGSMSRVFQVRATDENEMV